MMTTKERRDTYSMEDQEQRRGPIATNPIHIAREEDLTKLPPELADVDFGRPIAWGKHRPYPPSSSDGGGENADGSPGESPALPLVPEGTPPTFRPPHEALDFHIHATSGRARCATVHLPHGPVSTPVFMPGRT